MKIINIADERQRNARVNMEHKEASSSTRYVDVNQSPVTSVRVIKNTLNCDLRALTQDIELPDLSEQLVQGDPEIDMELFGKRVRETTRIFLNENNEPAVGVTLKEQVYGPDGELKEERDRQTIDPNINTEIPLSWSGKLLPKKDCCRKFVFVNAFQLRHIDGLTYDFLYSMAKKLETENAMMLVGSGKKSNQPLVLNRNGKQYRAFLEGRTKGQSYQLILHLTNLELKAIPRSES